MAGGIHRAGGNRIDARIHTTRDGLALDNFLVQDPLGRPFAEAGQIGRLTRAIEDALANRQKLLPKLEARALTRTPATAFRLAPRVFVHHKASKRFPVIEVNAHDRPPPLKPLSHAPFPTKVHVDPPHSPTLRE